jgi:hypothetical protein
LVYIKHGGGNGMIVKEFYRRRDDGTNLYKTYSDAGLLIKKTGTEEVYSIAIDTEDSEYVYEELASEETVEVL